MNPFTEIKNRVYTAVKIMLQRICAWGCDEEMDLFLKAGPVIFIFYKYREPSIVFFGEKDYQNYAPFVNGRVSKEFWKSIRKAVNKEDSFECGGECVFPTRFTSWSELIAHFNGFGSQTIEGVVNDGMRGVVTAFDNDGESYNVNYHCIMDLQDKNYFWVRKDVPVSVECV